MASSFNLKNMDVEIKESKIELDKPLPPASIKDPQEKGRQYEANLNNASSVNEILPSEPTKTNQEEVIDLTTPPIGDDEKSLCEDFEQLCRPRSKQILKSEPAEPQLSQAQLRRWRQLKRGSGEELLISKFNLDIRRADLWTLCDQNWLNDQVINFYMCLLQERSRLRTQLPRCLALNSFFALRLLQDGYSAVRRWTRKVDLFEMQLILVPVHVQEKHWCLATIDMRDRAIRYYDSLNCRNRKLMQALKVYLLEESLDKRQLPIDLHDWQLEHVSLMPQQENSYDCGVFASMCAEYLTRDQPLDFRQRHMVHYRKIMMLEIVDGELWQQL